MIPLTGTNPIVAISLLIVIVLLTCLVLAACCHIGNFYNQGKALHHRRARIQKCKQYISVWRQVSVNQVQRAPLRSNNSVEEPNSLSTVAIIEAPIYSIPCKVWYWVGQFEAGENRYTGDFIWTEWSKTGSCTLIAWIRKQFWVNWGYLEPHCISRSWYLISKSISGIQIEQELDLN